MRNLCQVRPRLELSPLFRSNRSLDDGMVACPICNRRMKNEAVFPHLDKCTGPQEAQQPAPSLG